MPALLLAAFLRADRISSKTQRGGNSARTQLTKRNSNSFSNSIRPVRGGHRPPVRHGFNEPGKLVIVTIWVNAVIHAAAVGGAHL
jgi:hypothetical protein